MSCITPGPSLFFFSSLSHEVVKYLDVDQLTHGLESQPNQLPVILLTSKPNFPYVKMGIIIPSLLRSTSVKDIINEKMTVIKNMVCKILILQWYISNTKKTEYILSRATELVIVEQKLPPSVGDIRDAGSVSGLGRSGKGHGNSFRYSCLSRTEDPCGLQFMGSQRVGHSQSNLACRHTLSNKGPFKILLKLIYFLVFNFDTLILYFVLLFCDSVFISFHFHSLHQYLFHQDLETLYALCSPFDFLIS